MKKAIAFAVAVFLLLSVSAAAFADLSGFDLSGLTLEELVALKDQLNLAIWNSAEWKSVEVPQGVWLVGEDIPAGKWTISALPGKWTTVNIGDHTVYDGTTVAAFVFQSVYAEDAPSYQPDSSLTAWTVELEAGQYVGIEHSTAVFSPYSGKPALKFN